MYRVGLDGDDALEVFVESGRVRVEGRAVDLSHKGVGALVPGDQESVVRLGALASVRLEGPGLRTPITLEARVSFRHQAGSDWRYGFRFVDEEALEAQVRDSQYRLFNRRTAYRVEPDPAEPVAVVLETTGAEPSAITGRLRDISADGLGVALELEEELDAFARDRIELAFRLPPGGAALRLAARIRRAELADERVCYGIEFDPDGSERFERQQEQITDYVMRRQREELRRKVRARQ